MDSATAAPPTNRRRYTRFRAPKRTFLGWQGAGVRHVSRVSEFSLGGMFIMTEHACAVGTPLEILFDVPGGEIRLRAVVRNVRPGKGMGVAVIKMAGDHRAQSDGFLKQLSCCPSHRSRPSGAERRVAAVKRKRHRGQRRARRPLRRLLEK